MLKENAKILTRIKEIKSTHMKAGLCQVLACVLVVPNAEAVDVLEFRLDEALTKLQKHMSNPHIQGSIPASGDEEDPKVYQVLLWKASDNASEQKTHLKKQPIDLSDVSLSRYTAYLLNDYDGSTGISINLTVPHRSEALSGKLDALAGSSVLVQITQVQTELNV